jgi:hypothetical protein
MAALTAHGIEQIAVKYQLSHLLTWLLLLVWLKLQKF